MLSRASRILWLRPSPPHPLGSERIRCARAGPVHFWPQATADALCLPKGHFAPFTAGPHGPCDTSRPAAIGQIFTSLNEVAGGADRGKSASKPDTPVVAACRCLLSSCGLLRSCVFKRRALLDICARSTDGERRVELRPTLGCRDERTCVDTTADLDNAYDSIRVPDSCAAGPAVRLSPAMKRTRPWTAVALSRINGH